MINKVIRKCFINQNDDEVVYMIIRKSFIVELPWLIISTFLIIILLNLNTILGDYFNINLEYDLIYFIQFSLAFAVLTYMSNKFFNWFYTINIITNQRIMDFDFTHLGDKNIVETLIKNVQSVTVKNIGFASFIFGLSTLQILTSGDNPNITFDYISNASKASDLISDLTRGVHPDTSDSGKINSKEHK
jgi:hypothetical protein